MKNKKILKIILIIILVIILITILAISILSNIMTYTATITEVDDNSIIIEDDSTLIPLSSNNMKNSKLKDVYGQLVYKDNNVYGTAKNLIYLDEAVILDVNWRKIDKDNLKIGDKIYIVSINGSHKQVLTIPPILYNVKFIKVLENAD